MSDIGMITEPNIIIQTEDDEEVEVISTSSAYSQVYSLTHKSNGERTSNLDRSYISFSFGGKWIEDWNLIVTYSDKIEKQATADFEDLTSEHDVVNGKFYWGTYFKNNTLSFTLSTDGITQSQLDDLKNWFAPGIDRELILAEHPNRAIMARISTPISLSVIPFEKDVALTVGGNTHLVTIANYKGEIEIEFTMDSPFWYAKNNIIESGNLTKDNLKIMMEDNIPSEEMVRKISVFGDSIYSYDELDNVPRKNSSLTIPDVYHQDSSSCPLIYYAGTASSYPIITFTTEPMFIQDYSSKHQDYIISPATKYDSMFSSMTIPVNYLKLTGTPNQFFYLSCPSIYTNFNEVISIFGDTTYTEVKELREQITNRVKHVLIRALALHFLNYLDRFEIAINYEDVIDDTIEDENGNSYFGNFKRVKLIALMKSAFTRDYTLPIIYHINGQTGQVTADIGYLTVEDYPVSKNSITTVSDTFPSTNYTQWLHLEDISEVIQSDFLVLKERNNFSSEGVIDYNSGKNILTHNFSTSLKNFTISYKYLYF